MAIGHERRRRRCSASLRLAASLVIATALTTCVSTVPVLAATSDDAPEAEFTGAVGYGFSVAISADGRTAVVGQLGTAYGSVQEHDWTEVGGLVHVFTFDGSSWSEQATLRASDQSYDLLFGNAVAISADGNTVIVGDPGECAYEHVCEHTAYVFTRTGTTWAQQAEFHGGYGFAGSVVLSADGNTALVGAGLSGWYGLSYGPEGNAPPTIFGRTGTTWTQEATLSTGAAPTMFDNFGHALALSADGKTALVGDPDANDGAGAAYVFTSSGSSWTQQAELSAADLPGSNLGDAVALSADGSTALVGAPYGSSGGTAYLYRDGGSGWAQEAQLDSTEAAGHSPGGWFGITVALNRDGSVALVGSPLFEEDLGAAFAFGETEVGWIPETEFTAPDETPFDYFGDAVSVDEAGSTVLIGREDPGGYFYAVPPMSTHRHIGSEGLTSTGTGGSGLAGTPPGDGAGKSGLAPGTPPGGGAVAPQVGSETFSWKAFRAAPHGGSTGGASARFGTEVIYTLNEAEPVRFTVLRAHRGRTLPSGRCAQPTHADHRGARCTRYTSVPGSFELSGNAGYNHFRFTGRLDGRKLPPGRYQLLASPEKGTNSSRSAAAPFQIIG
jgi:FG-GAP repeat